ncbi:hypothetical protein G0Q06_07235 [Puniceicoccales bacterium CK1056]|uniref:Uncharacterized protein n=1 Tax=Oceanipulchritudo coccoides TaxID=2706888 RepID=A0A6B2M1H8_9BACT|nr:hypothetical protein [Oceanipulchritudo coccoides]NDV62236.1 hypothetical protein [Oceanipulchritudo coccoides]
MSGNTQFWTHIGERVCAPLYFSMCHWIHEQISGRNMRKILFLARDGLILKDTWELLYGKEGSPAPLYLWASRRCLRIARMERLGDSEKALILSRKNLTPAQCLHQLGLDFPEPGADTGVAWNAPLRSRQDREAFMDYLDSVSGRILKQAKEERECLLAYLESVGLITATKEPVALVDLGWQGNLQAALQELLNNSGSQTELHGYYMGTIAPVGVQDSKRTSGLYFNHSSPEKPCRAIRHCQLLVETLFAAPHPSIKRIRREGNSFKPEYVPVDEHADIQPSLILMQRAALAHIQKKRECWEADPAMPLEEGFAELTRLLRKPNAKEAQIVGNVNHFGGFGQALDLHPLARPEGSSTSVWNLRNQYRRAYWRAGFLKRLKPWQRLALAPLIIGMPPDRS